jgi:hypothetical protein
MTTEPDDGCLYMQSGPDWEQTEIRGWWKDRMFIKLPDSMCRGGDIVELDREKLKKDRFATHDGYDFFTPDGKEKEDAANKATLAAGQMKAVKHLDWCHPE